MTRCIIIYFITFYHNFTNRILDTIHITISCLDLARLALQFWKHLPYNLRPPINSQAPSSRLLFSSANATLLLAFFLASSHFFCHSLSWFCPSLPFDGFGCLFNTPPCFIVHPHTCSAAFNQPHHLHIVPFIFYILGFCHLSFYLRDAMLARVFATATCLSVCLSICLSITRRYCA